MAKFQKAQVVALLAEMGADKAKVEKLPVGRLTDKVEKLPELLKDNADMKPKSADGKKLLKQLLKAVEDEELEIVEGSTKEKPKSEKPSKKSKAKAEDDEEDEDEDEVEDSDDEEDEDEEESEDEDEDSDEEETDEDEDEVEDSDDEDEDEDEEEEDEKPTKKSKKDKKKGKKSKAEAFKKVGIVEKLREMLQKATEKKPLSVEDAVTKLHEKYPDRDPDKMKKTTTGQFSYFFRHKEGLNVVNVPGKGYYIAEGKFKGIQKKEKSKKVNKKEEKAKKKSKKASDEEDDD